RGAVLLMHRAQCLRERAGLLAVEPRRWLVEQEEPWLGHERASDLHEAAATEAEGLDRPVGVGGEAEQRERRVDARALLRVGASDAEDVLPQRAVAAPGALGDHEVLAHGHAGEQLDALKRPRD